MHDQKSGDCQCDKVCVGSVVQGGHMFRPRCVLGNEVL